MDLAQEPELVVFDRELRLQVTVVDDGLKRYVGSAAAFAVTDDGQWLILETWDPDTVGRGMTLKSWARAIVELFTDRKP